MLLWKPLFKPQDHLLLLDYPVMPRNTIIPQLPAQEFCGIDLIYLYLCDIQSEQNILSKIPEEEIRESLLRYHSDYEEPLFNICAVAVKYRLYRQLTKEADLDRLEESSETEQFRILKHMAEPLDGEETSYLDRIAAESCMEFSAAAKNKYLARYLEPYFYASNA